MNIIPHQDHRLFLWAPLTLTGVSSMNYQQRLTDSRTSFQPHTKNRILKKNCCFIYFIPEMGVLHMHGILLRHLLVVGRRVAKLGLDRQ